MDQNKYRSSKVYTHTYPPGYPKDSPHWAMRRSWEIMDCIKPGAIPDDVRFFLAGSIAGALMRVADESPKTREED